MTNISKHPCGFTLIELAIVVIVLGVMLGIGLKLATNNTTATAYQNVNSQLDEIEDALYSFRETNNRLPCPADQTLAMTSGSFGVEATTPGTCTNGNILTYPSVTPTHKAGAVPVRALGLPDSMAIDPWGRKLMYAVKLDATATNAFITNPITSAWPGTLFTVNDESGSARTTSALYVLVSFGKNGHGGYLAGSGAIRMNAGSLNAAELENCDCTSTAVPNSPNLNTTYVQQPITTTNSANSFYSYDDVVRFKSRMLLASYAEENAVATSSSSSSSSGGPTTVTFSTPGQQSLDRPYRRDQYFRQKPGAPAGVAQAPPEEERICGSNHNHNAGRIAQYVCRRWRSAIP